MLQATSDIICVGVENAYLLCERLVASGAADAESLSLVFVTSAQKQVRPASVCAFLGSAEPHTRGHKSRFKTPGCSVGHPPPAFDC